MNILKDKSLITLLNRINDGLYIVDRDRTILFWNRQAELITGYDASEVLHSHCYDNILMHVDHEGKILCHGGCPLHATMNDGQERSTTVYLHHKEGHRVPVAVTVIPLYDKKGAVEGAAEFFTDKSQRQHLEEEISFLKSQVLYDTLTTLPNRRFLDTAINNLLNETRHYQMTFGLVFFDIDDFKHINDTYSHLFGDKVLKILSTTLNKNIRSSDIAGRWGGEEFIILLKYVNSDSLMEKAEKLRMLVSRSRYRTSEGENVKVTISGGATLARRDDSAVTLLKRADTLLYQSKNTGKNKITAG